MKKDILEIIERDMPNQVGKVLKEKLEQADKDAKELKETKERLKNALDLNQELNLRANSLEDSLSDHAALDERILQVEERERNLNLELYKIKLEEAEKRANAIHEYTGTLVKNTTLKRSVFSHTHKSGYTEPGTGHYVNDRNDNSDENETITEE